MNLSIRQVSMPDQLLAMVWREMEMNLRPSFRSTMEWTRLEMVSARSSWIRGLSDIHMQ